MKSMRQNLAARSAFFCLLGFSVFPFAQTASALPTSGTVIDFASGTPIENARVRIQGDDDLVFSDALGRYTIEAPTDNFFVVISAAKEGYVNDFNQSAIPGATNADIRLRLVPEEPLPNTPPFQDPINACAACHPTHALDWAAPEPNARPSRHSTAGENRWVRDLYDGSGGGAEGGNGYVFVNDSAVHDATLNPDGLHTSGLCAECHLPALSALADVSGTVRLSDATAESPEGSLARLSHDNGVFCGVCHKIEEVNDLFGRTGFFGNGSLRIGDPGVMFGPLDDSVFYTPGQMIAVYSPLHTESRVCAPCHEYNMDHDFDNDFNETGSPPGQSTYSEWLVSPFGAAGVTCQDCHMPTSASEEVILAPFGGIVRPGSQLHSHRFEGTTPAFLQAAVAVTAEASREGDLIRARVDVANVGAGHSFPTGVSIRNAMVVVRAKTQNGETLPPLAGTSLIPDWGGVGMDANDYGGTPGRGFAKVLQGRNGAERVLFIDAIDVVENTQIRSGAVDRSTYVFDASQSMNADITVEANLIYRRVWKDVGETKGWIGGYDGQGFPYEGDVLVESASVELKAEVDVTPVPRLDPAILLALLKYWRDDPGTNPAEELLLQQSRWYAP